ncbi:MAG: TerC family protein [Proteobacteria bacterium]|nr:TerC family protein [Pseudomonadota bacterium]
MELLTDPQAWLALATLTVLEIVLGIDNIIFITVLCDRLPEEQRQRARITGLGGAVVGRLLLLTTVVWIIRLSEPLFVALGREISPRDLILAGGGLFLLAKATREIHATMEGEVDESGQSSGATMASVLTQILLLDLVFSIDSVITAVGMAEQLEVMMAAVIISIGFMMFFAASVGDFVNRHPSVKMLALSFLLLVGVALIADGMHVHIPRGYIYFAMSFSFFVEMLNTRMRSTRLARAGDPRRVLPAGD